VGTLFVDQLTKLLIRGTPAPGAGALRIGVPATFDASNPFAVAIELLVLLVALAIVVLNLRRSSGDEPLGARLQSLGAAILAGAVLSNLLDRSLAGGVLTWIQLVPLPVVNVAHLAMALGAGLVALSIARRQ
jgi:lipoprotein signal peptidase